VDGRTKRNLKSTKVALVKCESYEREGVNEAVERAVSLIGGVEAFIPKHGPVLLKPNMLSPSPPERAVTTHPAVVYSVARLFEQASCKVQIGDSPGRTDVNTVASASGILAAAKEARAELVSFNEAENIYHSHGLFCREFTLGVPILRCGILVNLPKMKTHNLTGFTGAVKNLFGCIPGLRKSQMHLRFSDPYHFCGMLMDLALAVQPGLTVMDAIVAMDGQGPSHGDPFPLGAIIASTDPFAVDTVALQLVGVELSKVPYLQIFREQWGSQQIEVVGNKVEDFAETGRFFRMPTGTSKEIITRWLGVGRKYLTAIPMIDVSRCQKCGVCARSCPPRAISFTRDMVPSLDYSRCIRCYCCSELCPNNAIILKRGLLARLADRILSR